MTMFGVTNFYFNHFLSLDESVFHRALKRANRLEKYANIFLKLDIRFNKLFKQSHLKESSFCFIFISNWESKRENNMEDGI